MTSQPHIRLRHVIRAYNAKRSVIFGSAGKIRLVWGHILAGMTGKKNHLNSFTSEGIRLRGVSLLVRE